MGHPPFTEGDFLQLGFQHAYEPVPPLCDKIPTLAPEVEQVVMKALAKDPEQRFSSVQEFASALEEVYKKQEVRQAQTMVGKTKEQQFDERYAHYKDQQYKEEIQQRLQVQLQQRGIEQLNQLVRQRQLYEARNYLNTHPEVATQSESLKLTIERDIAQAQELIKQAQSRTMSQEERIERCRQALRLCADYQEARDLLSATPPAPPRNLQARVGEALVNLTWEPSSTPLVKYRIIRKHHSQPVSSEDGATLATAVSLSYDDITPEVGIPLYYAVFTDCEGVISLRGTTLRTPVLLTQDISTETVRVSDRQISISWQTPPNMQGIVVVRTEQAAPRSINDGTPLPISSLTGLVDYDVQNGQTYYYRVYCQFKDHQGNLVPSALALQQM